MKAEGDPEHHDDNGRGERVLGLLDFFQQAVRPEGSGGLTRRAIHVETLSCDLRVDDAEIPDSGSFVD